MKVLIVGYGSIGQALTPLLFEHFPELTSDDVHILTADIRGFDVAAKYKLAFHLNPIDRRNYKPLLGMHLGRGDLLINVSVDVSSLALVEWCQEHGVMYIDTCVEPWAGGYKDGYDVEMTTNHHLRSQMMERRGVGAPTAVIAHGANPGLVTHFVKQGLDELWALKGLKPVAGNYDGKAYALGIRTIHIAERDSQDDGAMLRLGEFKNTWSVDGFLSEAFQRAELGWGTHERTMPSGARRYSKGSDCGIYLSQASIRTKVKSWVPSVGEQDAYMITHHEALSIADFLTVENLPGEAHYRPTVYYAYHPSEQTIQSIDNMLFNSRQPKTKTIMQPKTGADELGVLFVYDGGAYWYGSTLTCDEARELAPHNSATSLQVVASMIGAIKWMIANPEQGVVEAEDLDFNEILRVSLPYLGNVRGVETNWQPGQQGNLQLEDFVVK